MSIRKQIFDIVSRPQSDNKASRAYNLLMLAAIVVSVIPLLFAQEYPVFEIIEKVCVALFIMDYFLRWITADFRLGRGKSSFLIYPVTGWAIIDLLSILPGLGLIGNGFKILRISRLLKIVRLLKLVRNSSKFRMLGKVISKEKDVLLTVFLISVFYVFITALIMFNAEPHINPVTGEPTFANFFDALYWATVTLTTVGYGDMIPVTDIGRFVSMLSAIFGVAIIALPSGVITAGYLDELHRERMNKDKEADEKQEID